MIVKLCVMRMEAVDAALASPHAPSKLRTSAKIAFDAILLPLSQLNSSLALFFGHLLGIKGEQWLANRETSCLGARQTEQPLSEPKISLLARQARRLGAPLTASQSRDLRNRET